jgi:hypothetical protein
VGGLLPEFVEAPLLSTFQRKKLLKKQKNYYIPFQTSGWVQFCFVIFLKIIRY